MKVQVLKQLKTKVRHEYVFPAPSLLLHIFSLLLLVNKATIISLEPCALLIFGRFIPRFNKNFLTLWIPLNEGLGLKEAQREGDFTDNFNIYTYTPQNNYTEGCV